MTRMSNYTILFGAVTLFSTLAGGLVAVRFGRKGGALAAFAAGVLIAVPLFDLLPEGIALAGPSGVPVRDLMYGVALGFIFLLILDRYLSVHRICEGGDVCRNVRHPRGGVFGALELSAHSFMDGLAIGFGFQLDYHVGIIVALAVIAHDFSDGINTVTVMVRHGNTPVASMKMLLLDAAAPLLGAATSIFLAIPEGCLVLLLSFFSGGFLYLGASDLLPEAHDQNPPPLTVALTLLGFLTIFILTRLVGI